MLCLDLPGHRGDSSNYANKGSASMWRKRETTMKTVEAACLKAANRTMRQGETILKVYLRNWEQKEFFFCNEGWGGGGISQIPSLLKNIQAKVHSP